MTTSDRDPEAVRIGATIRAIRRAHGLKVTELATACNTSRSFLNNVELGVKKAPMPLCVSIAKTFGIPLAAITVEGYERIAKSA